MKNFCEDLFFFFFFWRALALCVLGPWPWPRAFLSLASRVSVLGKAGLGLEFFLCPWPWPRALCPRLHLCCAGQHVIADWGTKISATGILSFHFVFLHNQNFNIDQ